MASTPASPSPSERRVDAGHWLRALGAPLVILAAGLWIYLPALDAPYVFDDATTVQLNPSILQLRPLTETFVGTRPLLNSSYALTHWLGGGAPWGHRLGNVLLHLANALLVYAWLRVTLSLPRFAARGPRIDWIPFAVALLFTVHPLQTEAVTYISGRSDALAAFFTLIAMLCIGAALHWQANAKRTFVARAAAISAVGAGLLCKENAAVTPVLMLIYDAIGSGRSVRQVVIDHWPFYGILALGGLIFGWAVLHTVEYGDTAGLAFASNPWGVSVYQYSLTEPSVIWRYLQLLVLPRGQCFDYDWPLATSLFSSRVWLPALVLLAVAAVAWALRHRAPLYTLAIAWFFITLAPTSSVIPIADVIAERRVYLASVGPLLVLVLVIDDCGRLLARRGVSHRAVRLAGAVALFTCVATLGWLAFQRNFVWQDALRLWTDSANTSPDSPRVHTNLGARQLERGNLAQARAELERAADLIRAGHSRQATPRQEAYNQTYLAVVYLKLLETERAAAAYQRAIDLGAHNYVPLARTLVQIRDALAKLGYRVS